MCEIDYPGGPDDLLSSRFRCKPCVEKNRFKGWHLRTDGERILADCITCGFREDISTFIGIVVRAKSRKTGHIA